MAKRFIVGITGASGSVYAKRLLQMLLQDGHQVMMTITTAGILVLEQELDWKLPPAEDEAAVEKALVEYLGAGQGSLKYYHTGHIGAPIASGSVCADGMIVVPCTMASVSAMACGTSADLLERAADVMMKERRRLVVAPREVPYSTIHLQNMLTLSQCGAIVAPASPAFYQRPENLDELVDNYVDRLLVLLGARQGVRSPWEGN